MSKKQPAYIGLNQKYALDADSIHQRGVIDVFEVFDVSTGRLDVLTTADGQKWQYIPATQRFHFMAIA